MLTVAFYVIVRIFFAKRNHKYHGIDKVCSGNVIIAEGAKFMELDKVFSLIDKAEKSSFNKIKIEIEDVKLSLERVTETSETTPAMPLGSESKSMPPSYDDNDIVFAPISGVFYIAKEPGAEPFAPEGKKVTKGDTLCIIEAMKMMNEIHAPKSGVIENVLKKDGEAIAAKDALFRYAKGN